MTFRTCIYSKNYGDGNPYLNTAGVWNGWILDDLAKYDVVITDAEPWSGHGFDLRGQLESRHPGIKLIAWVAGLCPWKNPNPAFSDKGADFPWELWSQLEKFDGWCRNPDGSLWTAPAYLPGRYIPDLRKAHARAAYVMPISNMLRGWDGIFLDMFPPSLLALCGPASLPERYIDSEWQAGHAAFLMELRNMMGPGYKIMGNSGPGPTNQVAAGSIDGWMRENFPNQCGGSWESNMLGYSPAPGDKRPGYLSQGPWSIISVMPNHTNDQDDERRATFGVCSALMGDGMMTIVGDQSDPLRSFRPKSYPIYQWARALGEPRGEMFDTGWPLYQRQYQNGLVVVNPTTAPVVRFGATFQPQSGTILP